MFRRLRHDVNRTCCGWLTRLRDLHAFRDSLYPAASHFIIDDWPAFGGHVGEQDRDATGVVGHGAWSLALCPCRSL